MDETSMYVKLSFRMNNDDQEYSTWTFYEMKSNLYSEPLDNYLQYTQPSYCRWTGWVDYVYQSCDEILLF